MPKSIKIISFIVMCAMVFGVLAGCGNTSKTPDTPAVTANAASTASGEAAKEEPKKEVTLTWYMPTSRGQGEELKQTIQMIKDKTGITVEPNILPGEDEEFYKKMDITLMSGDTTDLVNLDNPIIAYKYQKGGFLAPLQDIAKEKNADLEKEFGKYLKKDENGNIYCLPIELSVNAVFYNKKIFDDAGIPYPKAPWTWSQYIETAKKLTDAKKDIWGSYFEQYDNFFYTIARQKEVPAYKPDGTSNLDDPAFKESLQWFKDLGDVHKIQPSWLEMKTKKIAWNAFMNGNYGMIPVGSWFMGLLTNQKDYKRDWKWGVTALPTPDDGTGKNIYGVTTGLAVNAKSKNPKEAFDAVKAVADYWASDIYHSVPARVDLTADQYTKVFAAKTEQGDVTADDLKAAFFPEGLGFTDEKILGPACADISNIYMQEGELFATGQKSLDDTVAAIKSRADEAIKSEAASK